MKQWSGTPYPQEPRSGERESYFAPAQRVSPEEMADSVDLLSNNPLINALRTSVRGSIAVLNEYRQVCAVNEESLHSLGLENPSSLLGLRPG